KHAEPSRRAGAGTTSSRRGVKNDSATLVPLFLSLAAVMLLSKVWLLPFPVTGIGSFLRWLLRLAIVVAPDLCFATGLAVACWLVAMCLRHWPRVVKRSWQWCYLAMHGV